ncbi:hypothetical protein JJC00_06535 [Bradyrhizobium diazoefficiens]|nr:hypothetical protein [Bradyrhizobium diazoefficiens]QQO35336.1 hypothetical protein JJC00_06535 [Bradyrhizobium diazoefficiens]
MLATSASCLSPSARHRIANSWMVGMKRGDIVIASSVSRKIGNPTSP